MGVPTHAVHRDRRHRRRRTEDRAGPRGRRDGRRRQLEDRRASRDALRRPAIALRRRDRQTAGLVRPTVGDHGAPRADLPHDRCRHPRSARARRSAVLPHFAREAPRRPHAGGGAGRTRGGVAGVPRRARAAAARARVAGVPRRSGADLRRLRRARPVPMGARDEPVPPACRGRRGRPPGSAAASICTTASRVARRPSIREPS